MTRATIVNPIASNVVCAQQAEDIWFVASLPGQRPILHLLMGRWRLGAQDLLTLGSLICCQSRDDSDLASHPLAN